MYAGRRSIGAVLALLAAAALVPAARGAAENATPLL